MEPNLTDPRALLGEAVRKHQAGDLAAAIRGYRGYLALRPGAPEAVTNLAWATAATGEADAAVAMLQDLLRRAPEQAAAWNILGAVQQGRGDVQEAEACFRSCTERAPGFPDGWFNLGKLLLGARRLDDAVAAFEQARRLAPQRPEPWLGQCRARYFQGRLGEAMDLALAVRERFPSVPEARTEPVLLLNYARFEGRDIAAEHRELGRWLVQQAGPQPAPGRRVPGAGPLRVGYVASNLHQHSNFRCVGPVIAAHDRTAVEVFVYHGGERVDDATRGLAAAVAHWRDCRGRSPDQVATLMRADRLDLAVGCEGLFHTFAPMVLARRPAPVQATWSGYPHPLGLPTVDYRITDAVLDPPGEGDAAPFERPWRLPWFRSFLPPAEAPDPAPRPRPQEGPLTLVSFNNLAKLGDACLRLWGRVHQGLPGSRLRIAQADPGSGRERLRERLGAAGFDLDRVELLPYLNHEDHLAVHLDADLHLDSYPYPGVTVAATALWMGLPSVCIADTAAGREGAAQLTAAGFPELVAADEDAYVETYLRFGRDPAALAGFRASARRRMAAAPLLDPAGLARQLEATYAGMVAGRPPG